MAVWYWWVYLCVESPISGSAGCSLTLSIPLICSDHELELISPEIHSAAAQVMREQGYSVPYTLCSSMDTPRCCMRADAIAGEGDAGAVLFDTDSLTAYVYGFNSADCDQFLGTYIRKHILSGKV